MYTQIATEPAVDCSGFWSACNALCKRVFTVTVPPSGGGKCATVASSTDSISLEVQELSDGDLEDCSPGVDLCIGPENTAPTPEDNVPTPKNNERTPEPRTQPENEQPPESQPEFMPAPKPKAEVWTEPDDDHDMDVNPIKIEHGHFPRSDGKPTAHSHPIGFASAAASLAILILIVACIVIMKRKRSVGLAWFGLEREPQGVPVGIA